MSTEPNQDVTVGAELPMNFTEWPREKQIEHERLMKSRQELLLNILCRVGLDAEIGELDNQYTFDKTELAAILLELRDLRVGE